MNKEKHDLVIIGTGAAGVSAAIYAARYKMDFIIIGRLPGGNMTESYNIENYPGLEDTIPGHVLGDRMLSQLERFGHRPKLEEVRGITKQNGSHKFLVSTNNSGYGAKAILLALGLERNRLDIPGEKDFEGRGVAYCATCDGYFYKDKKVAVVGGGDSAVTAALYLSDIAKDVTLIVRKPELRAEPTWQEKIKKIHNIKILFETVVKEIAGTDKVEKITVETNSEKKEILLDGIFIEIGQMPQTTLLHQTGVKLADGGVVSVKENQRTSVKGIWAAGDITNGSNNLRQIVTAAAEGAVAAVDIYTELKKSK